MCCPLVEYSINMHSKYLHKYTRVAKKYIFVYLRIYIMSLSTTTL